MSEQNRGADFEELMESVQAGITAEALTQALSAAYDAGLQAGEKRALDGLTYLREIAEKEGVTSRAVALRLERRNAERKRQGLPTLGIHIVDVNFRPIITLLREWELPELMQRKATGRKPHAAPEGYLTLGEIAYRLAVSTDTIRRRRALIDAERSGHSLPPIGQMTESGMWILPQGDLQHFEKRAQKRRQQAQSGTE